MNDLERVITECLQRIFNFGEENKDVIAVNAIAAAAFAAIAEYVGLLDVNGALRTSANATKLTQTGFRRMKRHELNGFLTWMSRTARDIAKNDPNFINKFRIEHKNLNDAVLLETARAFYSDSQAVEADFIGYAMPEDFREQLDTLIKEFDAAINAQDAALRDRVEANATVDDVIDRALTGRRTLLVIVPNLFRNNPGKLADWASASHIEKLPKKKKNGGTPTK